mgnify:CR=1 FL=1
MTKPFKFYTCPLCGHEDSLPYPINYGSKIECDACWNLVTIEQPKNPLNNNYVKSNSSPMSSITR